MLRKLCCAFAILTIGLTSTAGADVLLLVDLSVTDQVTITATSGLSDTSISDSDNVGVYLEGFYSGPRTSSVTGVLSLLASLTNFENPADGTPSLFTAADLSDPGLNIFSWSTDSTVSFTAGSQAFIGSATWTLPNDDYLEMLAGNSSGNLWFPADDRGDLSTARVLGTWQRVGIPEPGSLFVLSLAAIGLLMRRRC